jgi:hypothetical protein
MVPRIGKFGSLALIASYVLKCQKKISFELGETNTLTLGYQDNTEGVMLRQRPGGSGHEMPSDRASGWVGQVQAMAKAVGRMRVEAAAAKYNR